MEKQKFNYKKNGFAVLLLIAAFFAGISMAKAQNAVYDKPLKYELSIDLAPVIDEGQFGKIYFKIKQFDGNQEKGAFRLGVSKGIYSNENYDQSTFPENVTTSSDKSSHLEMKLFFGYEKYKKIGSVLTYYGIDMIGSIFIKHKTPQNYTDDQKVIALGICPFWGIKHYLLKNKVSASFEVGWENSLNMHTNQSSGMTHYVIISEIQLPYSLTINYHF